MRLSVPFLSCLPGSCTTHQTLKRRLLCVAEKDPGVQIPCPGTQHPGWLGAVVRSSASCGEHPSRGRAAQRSRAHLKARRDLGTEGMGRGYSCGLCSPPVSVNAHSDTLCPSLDTVSPTGTELESVLTVVLIFNCNTSQSCHFYILDVEKIENQKNGEGNVHITLKNQTYGRKMSAFCHVSLWLM